MTKPAGIALILLVLVGVHWLTLAGSLTPPAPPSPTMFTLEQLSSPCIVDGVCGLPKTGQTDSVATGDDGDIQAGYSVDPRFTDNLDGTVTDHLTGLIWLQDTSCFALIDWSTAVIATNALDDGQCGLTDGSVAGDWRLSNNNELLSLLLLGQDFPDHVFSNGPGGYWSSTSYAPDTTQAWYSGSVSLYAVGKGAIKRPWPVRGGL